MKNTRAALRYAKALLSLTVENKQTALAEQDMQATVDLFAASQELTPFLENPTITNAVKESTLLKLFPKAAPITQQLIQLLSQNNRIDFLDEVAASYLQLLSVQKGEATATVTTAVALTPALEKTVLEKATSLSAAKLTLVNRVDPSIIGGFILRIGDLQYNASVAHQLEQMKRELTQTNYSA